MHAGRIATEALNGDHIMVDGDQATVHLRPDDSVVTIIGTLAVLTVRSMARKETCVEE